MGVRTTSASTLTPMARAAAGQYRVALLASFGFTLAQTSGGIDPEGLRRWRWREPTARIHPVEPATGRKQAAVVEVEPIEEERSSPALSAG